MYWSDLLFPRAAWKPFSAPAPTRDAFNRICNAARIPPAFRAGDEPPLNVWTRDNAVLVALWAPGWKAENIAIGIEKQSLT
ncbi:MAG: hypothetical protein ACREJ2_06540, partial [Planctomycetota bacterium]